MNKVAIPLVILILICTSTTGLAQNWVQSGHTKVDLNKFVQPASIESKKSSGSRGEILVNPGFETGTLPPWYTNNWTVTNNTPHSGIYCATDEGNYWIRQDFSNIPSDSIASITLWSRQPEEAIQAVDMMYSDGTYDEDIIWPKKDWQQFDVTSFLSPGKVLIGLRIWGYSGGGPDPDISFNDDISLIIDDLYCDTYTLSELGGSINFFMNAGGQNAFRQYLLLGSVSGTSPGTPLPGGLVTLPLNYDVFTNIVISFMNTSTFDNFMGALDASGKANAKMNVVPGSGTAGINLYFAYLLSKPFDFVSTPVQIEIVP